LEGVGEDHLLLALEGLRVDHLILALEEVYHYLLAWEGVVVDTILPVWKVEYRNNLQLTLEWLRERLAVLQEVKPPLYSNLKRRGACLEKVWRTQCLLLLLAGEEGVVPDLFGHRALPLS